MHDWNNSPNQQHVQSFSWMKQVTNKCIQYLFWVKTVFLQQKKITNIFITDNLDTLVWRNRLGYNETMTNNYLRHPAYADYPVVGVNWIPLLNLANGELTVLMKTF